MLPNIKAARGKMLADIIDGLSDEAVLRFEDGTIPRIQAQQDEYGGDVSMLFAGLRRSLDRAGGFAGGLVMKALGLSDQQIEEREKLYRAEWDAALRREREAEFGWLKMEFEPRTFSFSSNIPVKVGSAIYRKTTAAPLFDHRSGFIGYVIRSQAEGEGKFTLIVREDKPPTSVPNPFYIATEEGVEGSAT